MMDDVVLKKATIGDLEAVQILNQKLFKREFEKYNKLLNIEWTFAEKGTNYFQQLIENDSVYVAKIEENIIGYLAGCIHNKNECFTEQFAEIENIPIYFDGRDPLEWVGHMNNIKDRAEEIVFSELIYV